MSEELDVPTADMLEIVAGGGNGVEYVNLPWLLESAAKELRTVIRERDEARAEAKGLNDTRMLLTTARAECNLMRRERDEARKLADYYASGFTEEAEARGYQRGVEDAAKVANSRINYYSSLAAAQAVYDCCKAILELLKQTEHTNSPHLEIGAGRSAKRE